MGLEPLQKPVLGSNTKGGKPKGRGTSQMTWEQRAGGVKQHKKIQPEEENLGQTEA